MVWVCRMNTGHTWISPGLQSTQETILAPESQRLRAAFSILETQPFLLSEGVITICQHVLQAPCWVKSAITLQLATCNPSAALKSPWVYCKELENDTGIWLGKQGTQETRSKNKLTKGHGSVQNEKKTKKCTKWQTKLQNQVTRMKTKDAM